MTDVERYLEAARLTETPPFSPAIKLVEAYRVAGDYDQAYAWLRRAVDAAAGPPEWQAAAAALTRLRLQAPPELPRHSRVALAGSYTTTQLGSLLRLAAFRDGVDLDLYESRFGQYSQDLLDPGSELFRFKPEIVVLAAHDGALQIPPSSDDPEAAVDLELARWQRLWDCVGRAGGRVIQHSVALRPEDPLGHLAGRVASRHAMVRLFNVRLLRSAPAEVVVLDCERLAAALGTSAWFDDRYWYLTKQAVGPQALPTLARHTASLMAAALGLNRKCLVLDLDGTLWGGVIGEDGLDGIRLGSGAAGEAFVDFQTYVLGLKQKGIVLAVASKNNEADARLPFERHPDMRLRLDDIAVFLANWDDKATNIRRIAAELNLPLRSLTLVDDNPAERALIRQQLPEVDVIAMPPDVTGYRAALAGYLRFETVALTEDDVRRTEQYRARQAAAALAATAGSLEEFHRSLEMRATVAPFDDLHLPRIAQLIAKTNQFNLTGRRRNIAELRALMADPDAIHFYLKLRDRFTDHGLVAALIASKDDDTLQIDTWVMSCRVIGRTVEAEMLKALCHIAAERGCRRLRGVFNATGRNEPARDVYRRFAFSLVEEQPPLTTWEYDLASAGPIENGLIGPWTDEPAPRRVAMLVGEQTA